MARSQPRRARAEPLIGRQVGGYRILEKLGEGGMGVVYRGEDGKLGRSVALKFLNTGLGADDKARARFLREAQLAAGLSHPNICPVYGVDEARDGQLFIVMAYCEGEPLSWKLQNGPFEPRRAAAIAGQVAAGLAVAHGQGVIHRDIKPSNLLVSSRDEVRILDFGVARAAGQQGLTQVGRVVGTLWYMSPEQARGAEPDPRADLWSLGVVLFEMLAGRLPFESASDHAYVYSLFHERPDLAALATSPAALVDVVERCLARVTSERYASAAELADDLAGWERRAQRPAPARRAELELPATEASRPAMRPRLPPFAVAAAPARAARAAVAFVGREGELALLDARLATALGGQGGVVFVSGEAGCGKSALVQTFCERAEAAHGELVIVAGECNAQTGLGDPYLPFREALCMLACVDLEARWSAGALTLATLERLWRQLPDLAQVLSEAGPELVDTLVPAGQLFAHLQAIGPTAAAVLPIWRQLADRSVGQQPLKLEQAQLFGQYARVLAALARRRPLVVVLEDLHWVDAASASLLFHLARRIHESRVLIVGTFRPSDLAAGEGDGRHPLAPVVNELKRQLGDIEVEVGKGEGRRFVDALLDLEPNRLSEGFREALFRQTGAHPLFVVELLRALKARAAIVRDAQGAWVEQSTVGWGSLPARVEAMLGERLDRLPRHLRDLLAAASVQGQRFDAEVVARLRGLDPREVVRQLGSELDRRHQLVTAEAMQRIAGRRVSAYRFSHALYQRYLYEELDPAERAYLHEEVGVALEDVYGEAKGDVAADLARHFEAAGDFEKTVDHLLAAAAGAVRVGAEQEALAHLERGRGLLEQLPPAGRERRELAVLTALAPVLTAQRGYGAVDLPAVYERAEALARRAGDDRQLFWILWGQGATHLVCGRLAASRERAGAMLALVEERGGAFADAAVLRLGAHYAHGIAGFFLGEPAAAGADLARAIALDEPGRRHPHLALTGEDAGTTARCFAAFAAWAVGRGDEARVLGDQAVELARGLGHPLTLAFAQVHAAFLALMLADSAAARRHAMGALTIAEERSFAAFLLMGGFVLAAADAMECLGPAPAMVEVPEVARLSDALTRMEQILGYWRGAGVQIWQTYFLAHIGAARAGLGDRRGAAAALAQAQAAAATTGERFYASELTRLAAALAVQPR